MQSIKRGCVYASRISIRYVLLGLLYMWGLHTTEHVYLARAAASTSVKKFDDWIYNFTWKHLNLQQLLVFVNICSVHPYITDHASSPWPPLPPLFFLTVPKESQKKFSELKQVHVAMEPSKTKQTRWEWHHNTFTPFLHLVPFCQLCTPWNTHWPIHIH